MENPFDLILEELRNVNVKVESIIKKDLNDDGLNKDEFILIDEAARLLGVGVRTVYNFTSKRRIRHYKPGSVVYFSRSDINDYIRKGIVEPSSRRKALIK